MGIIKTTLLALTLAGGASGNGLEKTVRQEITTVHETPRTVTINGATYRQRPPGAACDPELYGKPIKEEPQPIPTGPIYFGLLAAAVVITATALRKRQDEMIEKYTPRRQWNFFGDREEF